MLGFYLILSTILFLILFAIWKMGDAANLIFRIVFFLSGVFGIINVLIHYGLLNSG